MKVKVADPRAWMLTSVQDVKRQLARCAFAAGLSRGRLDTFACDGGSFEGCPSALQTEDWSPRDFDAAEALVARLLNMKPFRHSTVIEHSAVTFLIRCSRIASHEIVRHRLSSITQQSTRYCESGKDGSVTFIRPLDRPEDDCGEYDDNGEDFYTTLPRKDGAAPMWVAHAAYALAAYRGELKSGRKREFARYLLPHHVEVWLAQTANFREWQHILRMRTQKLAAPEVRLIFGQVKEQLAAVSPVLVEGL